MKRIFSDSLPSAILFDLDGTLVDSVPDIASAFMATLQELNLPVPTEVQARDWVGNGAKKLVLRGLAWAKQKNTDEVNTEELNAAHQLFLHHYKNCNGEKSCLYEGVLEALQYWQRLGIPMAIVTNKPTQFVPKLLRDLDIADFFTVVIGGDCVTDKKPNSMMLYAACERLNANPEMCLMVGDSRNDIEAARAAGIPVVAVDYGYNHGRPVAMENPDILLKDLTELFN